MPAVDDHLQNLPGIAAFGRSRGDGHELRRSVKLRVLDYVRDAQSRSRAACHVAIDAAPDIPVLRGHCVHQARRAGCIDKRADADIADIRPFPAYFAAPNLTVIRPGHGGLVFAALLVAAENKHALANGRSRNLAVTVHREVVEIDRLSPLLSIDRPSTRNLSASIREEDVHDAGVRACGDRHYVCIPLPRDWLIRDDGLVRPDHLDARSG
ncbi:hypothetical protein [Paenibacillus catalpae]|uniref:hypothetical protein n=1 Tax=Paenibacillus catalpae TaxID=1045775 RepID=UPI001113FDD5|nr:hypothetical protein [Paenibacillus catalpae]